MRALQQRGGLQDIAAWVQFARVKLAAAWLLVPYLAWVSLAVALNLSIWKQNP